MWNIKAIENNIFDCLTGLMVSYASYLNIDYRYCFVKSWGYYFLESKGQLLGDKIHFCVPFSIFSMLEKYCGLYIVEGTRKTFSVLKEYVKENLEQTPVIIDIDAFDCPWCPIYQKHHFDHYLMIVDYDEEAFYCVDSYFPALGIQRLDYSILTNWYGSIRVFLKRTVEVADKVYIQDIVETVTFLKSVKYVEHIGALKEYFCNEDNIKLNLKGFEEDPNHSPLFLILRSIIMQRKQFLLALSFLADRFMTECLDNVIESISKVRDLYSSLHVIILKQIVIGKYETNRLEGIMMQIIAKEGEALELLEKQVENLYMSE